MPLPQRAAPKANPSNAKAPASASRLPKLPEGGLKERKAYTYIDCPDNVDRCFYLLRIKDVEQFLTKDNEEKVKFVFEVLDTDVKSIRIGTEASHLLALQGKASLYFWSDFAQIILSACQQELSQQALTDFEETREATYGEVVGDKTANGLILRCDLKRAVVDDKKSKEPGAKKTVTYRNWGAATDEEIAKYTTGNE